MGTGTNAEKSLLDVRLAAVAVGATEENLAVAEFGEIAGAADRIAERPVLANFGALEDEAAVVGDVAGKVVGIEDSKSAAGDRGGTGVDDAVVRSGDGI